MPTAVTMVIDRGKYGLLSPFCDTNPSGSTKHFDSYFRPYRVRYCLRGDCLVSVNLKRLADRALLI